MLALIKKMLEQCPQLTYRTSTKSTGKERSESMLNTRYAVASAFPKYKVTNATCTGAYALGTFISISNTFLKVPTCGSKGQRKCVNTVLETAYF